MIKSLLLVALILPACAPKSDCCRERDTIADTLKAIVAERNEARRMLEELQSSVLEEKTKNAPEPTIP